MSRGGARPGAGRKRIDNDVRVVLDSVSDFREMIEDVMQEMILEWW